MSDDQIFDQAAIDVRNLEYVYMKDTPLAHRALSGVTMHVERGECVAIIGQTGSGKSTLAQHFNGLLSPQKGRLFVGGEDLSDPTVDFKVLRSKVGLVFQSPESQIFEKVVGDEIAYGPLKAGLTLDQARERVRWAMEMVGLDFDAFKDRSTDALSGGEKRKVAIAGVLALRPEILVLDEPTAGLDPRSRDELLGRLHALNREERITIVLISHRIEDVFRLADRLYVLSGGKNVLEGPPETIFGDRHLLENNQIGLPEIVDILYRLERSGFAVDAGCFDVDQVADRISRIVKTGEKQAGAGS